MNLTILICVLLTCPLVWSSTFIGNGGNAGDIELQVAVRQLNDTLISVVKDKESSSLQLCTCYSRFEGRPMCKALQTLSEEQVQYCAAYIQDKAPQMIDLLSQRERIHFNWTSESIEVKESNNTRSADAVTDSSKSMITINKTNFIKLSAAERIFLLAHEVFHMTQKDSKYLSDEGIVGPFLGTDGGRQFINSMSTGLVMESYRYGIHDKYKIVLNRSQAIKASWVSLGYSSLTIATDPANPYTISDTGGVQLGFRYQFSDWGLVADYSSYSADKGILSSSQGKEERQVYGLGLAYRWLPFEDPTTFRGQSHFVFTLKLEKLSAKYKLSDQFVSLEDSAKSTAAAIGANYYIPLRFDFWIFAGLGFSTHQYEYAQLKALNSDAQYKNTNVSYTLGASYAF